MKLDVHLPKKKVSGDCSNNCLYSIHICGPSVKKKETVLIVYELVLFIVC